MFFFSPAVDFTLGMFSTGNFNRSTYHLKVKDVRANCFCASLLHLYYIERALSNKMNNDRADDHCYSFAWT